MVFSSIIKEGGFDEIFRVLKEKQRFSAGIQTWNIKSKSVSGDVRAGEQGTAHGESSGNISK